MSIQPAQGIIGISRRKWLGLTIGVGAIALGGAYISKSSTQGLYAGNGASKLQVFDLQTAATLGAPAQFFPWEMVFLPSEMPRPSNELMKRCTS